MDAWNWRSRKIFRLRARGCLPDINRGGRNSIPSCRGRDGGALSTAIWPYRSRLRPNISLFPSQWRIQGVFFCVFGNIGAIGEPLNVFADERVPVPFPYGQRAIAGPAFSGSKRRAVLASSFFYRDFFAGGFRAGFRSA